MKRPNRPPDFIHTDINDNIDIFWFEEMIEEYHDDLYKIRYTSRIEWKSNILMEWNGYGTKDNLITSAYKKWLISKTLKEKLCS